MIHAPRALSTLPASGPTPTRPPAPEDLYVYCLIRKRTIM